MPDTITPYLFYEDAGAAMDWLAKAFGLRETVRMEGEGGRVAHGELELGGQTVMLGEPGGDYRNPRRLGGGTAGVHVYVDDVDAHFEQAREAGATILRDPTDQEYGDRRYDCEDLEGHQWYIATAMSPTASGEDKAAEHASAE
ncbi:MAG: VOC family protein [Gaiellaceae bacterium]